MRIKLRPTLVACLAALMAVSAFAMPAMAKPGKEKAHGGPSSKAQMNVSVSDNGVVVGESVTVTVELFTRKGKETAPLVGAVTVSLGEAAVPVTTNAEGVGQVLIQTPPVGEHTVKATYTTPEGKNGKTKTVQRAKGFTVVEAPVAEEVPAPTP